MDKNAGNNAGSTDSSILPAGLQDSIHALLGDNRLWYELPPAIDELYLSLIHI